MTPNGEDETKQEEYKVEVTLDVDAADPVEAAEQAYEILRDKDCQPWLCQVYNKATGKQYFVDLSAIPRRLGFDDIILPSLLVYFISGDKHQLSHGIVSRVMPENVEIILADSGGKQFVRKADVFLPVEAVLQMVHATYRRRTS